MFKEANKHMGSHMTKRLGAILLAIPLSGASLAAGFTTRRMAHAGNVPRLEGATVSGVLLCGESPVIVEKEELFLRIGDLPVLDAEPDAVKLVSPYDACVKTQYTFFNPTGEDVSLKLLFPQALQPSYVWEDCAGCHSVTVNDEPVETTMRHSYSGYYSPTLDFENSLLQIMQEQTVDNFYSNEALPVSEYLFHVDVPAADDAGYDLKFLTFALTFECNPARTRILSENRMTATTENGRLQVCFDVTEGENTVKLATIGEGIENLSYGVYTDRFCTNKLEIASPSYSKSETTFPAYASRFRPEDSDISESDWFNGFVQMLTKNTNASNKCMIYGSPYSLREEAFMRWYSYELTIPAESRLVHAVSSPLYPTVDGSRYDYSYLLSSQQRWSQVKYIEINIQTPYKLAYSNLDFTEREGGYFFKRERLPIGELNFTLTESEIPAPTVEPVNYNHITLILIIVIVSLGSIAAVVLLSFGAALTVVLVRRRRAKARKKHGQE